MSSKTNEALQKYFKENIDEIIKYLVELYEFQENIQIDYKIIKRK